MEIHYDAIILSKRDRRLLEGFARKNENSVKWKFSEIHTIRIIVWGFIISQCWKLVIRASDSQNALARCNFRSTRELLPQWFTNYMFFPLSRTKSRTSSVLVHLPDAFLGSQTDFTVLSPILSSIYDTPWKYFYISEFAYIPGIERLEKTNLSAGGRLTFFRSEWKITLEDFQPKDNYNVGTLIFKTVPDESWMNKWIEWPHFS